jgi:predicted TIM-barrel enzyme
MSRFVQKLKSFSGPAGAPIGFHASVAEPKIPVMLLVATLSGTQIKEARILADANADGGLVSGENTSGKVVKQMVEAMGNVPLGVFVKGMKEEKMNELVSSGCDFIVFDIKVPAAILQREDVGKLLMMEPSLGQGLVRAVNSLEIDGVLITGSGGGPFLALEHLLVCRRFVELLEKPVLIALPSLISKGELTGLWQAGVDGIIAPSTQSADALTELKKMIGDLPRGARGRRAKAGVMLPHYGEGAAEGENGEEEGI